MPVSKAVHRKWLRPTTSRSCSATASAEQIIKRNHIKGGGDNQRRNTDVAVRLGYDNDYAERQHHPAPNCGPADVAVQVVAKRHEKCLGSNEIWMELFRLICLLGSGDR